MTHTIDRAARPRARQGYAGISGYTLMLVCLICCIGMLCFATGCRNSDALKEIIYDQTSEIIDYDNEDKYLINSSDADEESDEVSSDETSGLNQETERTQNIVVYSSDPNSEDYLAKKAIWDEDHDFTGIEASEAVFFYVDETVETEEEDAPDEDESDTLDEELAGITLHTGTSEETSESSGGEGDSEEEGEASTGTSESVSTEAGTGAGTAVDVEVEVTTVDTTGDFVDPPTGDHIAAFGQFAIIVQMIGGEGALVAADEELLSDSGFQKVFADEGASDIVVGWSDDGEDASTIDVDAIIESGAYTIIVDDDTYQDDMTNADKQKLEDAGISFTVVSSLVSSTLIKKTVTTVGKMLAESTVIGNAGETTTLANQYKTFHDDLVSECLDANSNTLATYDSKVFETNNSKSFTYNSSADWTLLIDAWDDSVTYSDGSLTMNGIGLTTVGWRTRPTSYYIQVGGVVNSASAKGGNSSQGLYAVWQFYQGYRAYKSNFDYDSDGLFADSLTSQSSSNRTGISSQAWGDVFFSKVSVNGGTIGGSGVGGLPPDSFGSDSFPTVIAATQSIKEKLIENSAEEDGAYHPYDYQSGTFTSAYWGFSDNLTAWACIGATDGTVNAFASESGNVISDDAVLVSPCGLFTSWTAEGSVEGVLLSAWVNDVVNDDSDDIGWEDYVEEFYSTFYRYDVTSSDMSTIEAGLEE